MAEPLLARVQTRNTPAENLRLHLLRNRAHHDALATDAGLAARLRALRQWQSQRMHRTHADLLANKTTGDALRFLIDQVYCGQDYSARAADIEQAYPLMVRLLPRKVLQTAAVAMKLYVLTKELDRRLADCLFLRLDAADLHDDIVAEAYRLTNDYRHRAQQIELVRELGHTLTQYTRSNVFNTALRILVSQEPDALVSGTRQTTAELAEEVAGVLEGFDDD